MKSSIVLLLGAALATGVGFGAKEVAEQRFEEQKQVRLTHGQWGAVGNLCPSCTPIRTTSANTIADAELDHYIIAIRPGALQTVTVSLPPCTAPMKGREFIIVKQGSGLGTIVVGLVDIANDLINNATSLNLGALTTNSATAICDGANYWNVL